MSGTIQSELIRTLPHIGQEFSVGYNRQLPCRLASPADRVKHARLQGGKLAAHTEKQHGKNDYQMKYLDFL
jgi:hypothetical protein